MEQTRRGLAAIALAATGLAGCAAASDKMLAEPASAGGDGAAMICNADPAQYHIGHDATQAMGAAILKDSGARTLRWGPPGGAWTMDYRQDRVGVEYDGQMKITRIACG